MKNIKKSSVFLLALLFMISCQKDEYSMGEALSSSEIDFEVIQDYDTDASGNTVILKFNTPGVTPVWNYGTGKSTRAVDTVQYAFQGDYTINLQAITRGGIVNLDPVTVEVTDDNLNYVSDPLWEALTGGVGESRTWYLDLDEEGNSKYFLGPLYFYGTNNGWLAGGEAWDGGDTGCYGEDCWSWTPEYPSNNYLMPTGDYGSITFNLQGGPNVSANHLMLPELGEQNGTFFLDRNEHTLNLNGVKILHSVNNDDCVNDWTETQILSLTEDFMQLAVFRHADCDGEALLTYNFISEEYIEDYVPEPQEAGVDEGFEPEFEEGELLEILGWAENADSSRDWGWNTD